MPVFERGGLAKPTARRSRMKSHLLKNLSCLALTISLPVAAWSATPAATTKNEPPAKSVDLFAGMESGDINVVMIQKDSTQGMLTIANRTDKPLTVKIPEAFAGVP